MKLEETDVIGYLRSDSTKTAVVDTITANLGYYLKMETEEAALDYSGSIYNWFLGECVSRNQYALFTERQYEQIHGLYKRFVFALRGFGASASPRTEIERLVDGHRSALISVLRDVTGLSVRHDTLLPCAEYRLALQKDVLRIDPEKMMEPILDIGCGEKALLVKALRKGNKNAIGIDQYMPSGDVPGILRKNWLEFEYFPDYWGSVIAHMSFSNHFIHALWRNSALAERYRKTYAAILASLKVGAAFTYAPSLAPVEEALDKTIYRIEQFENFAGKRELNTTRVTRIR